jgi:hypothetical protein
MSSFPQLLRLIKLSRPIVDPDASAVRRLIELKFSP